MPSLVDERTAGKWRELIQRLAYSTRQRAIEWREGVKEDAFSVKIGSIIVNFEVADQNDRSSYIIRIQDQKGKDVETFDDVDLDADNYNREYSSMLRAMHVDIARTINGADQVLDTLLAALPALPPEKKQGSDLDDDIPF